MEYDISIHYNTCKSLICQDLAELVRSDAHQRFHFCPSHPRDANLLAKLLSKEETMRNSSLTYDTFHRDCFIFHTVLSIFKNKPWFSEYTGEYLTFQSSFVDFLLSWTKVISSKLDCFKTWLSVVTYLFASFIFLLVYSFDFQ